MGTGVVTEGGHRGWVPSKRSDLPPVSGRIGRGPANLLKAPERRLRRLTCSANKPILPAVSALCREKLFELLIAAAAQFFAVSINPGSLGRFVERLTARSMRCSNHGR